MLERGIDRGLLHYAEHTYRLEPFHEETPARIFDRRWARTLLETSLDRLRDESKGSGGAARYELLVPFMGGDAPTGYREVAEELQMTESATRVTVHRMRRRFRAILRDEVARTVQDESQVDDEPPAVTTRKRYSAAAPEPVLRRCAT